MRKCLLGGIISLLFAVQSFAQLSLSMATGTGPVIPTGWVTGGSTTTVGSVVQLTGPSASQVGRVYYGTPQTLTGCGMLNVEFEFQIIPSASAFAVADGIAFWIVNPLSGFGGGMYIGLPTNPNGLVLVLDTYDNDGVANDPLISLYGYPSGFTGNYVEGVTTNRIGNLNNQYFVRDGGWHHIKVTYNAGVTKVYFNHSATPSISGSFALSTTGYIGFSSSTGGAWSTQSIRNVYVYSDNVTPINGPGVVCMGTTANYTDSSSGGTWSSTNTAVGTINTTGQFTPISAGTTTISYVYNGGACTATKVVTVDPTTLPAITGPSSTCASANDTFTNTVTGGTWSSSPSYVATIGSSNGILAPLLAGTTNITYTLPVGCFVTKQVTLNTSPPAVVITPSPASVCNNGTLGLTASGATPYFLIAPQGWEHGVPTTAGVPVDGWSYSGPTPAFWYQTDGATATSPTIGAAYSGSYVAIFNSHSLAAGSSTFLNSPNFSMIGVTSATFSAWVYRDATAAYNTATYDGDALGLYAFSTIAGTYYPGPIPRRTGAGIAAGITGTSTPATSGWYQYSVTLPATFTGATNNVALRGFCANGNNIYVDSVTVTGTLAPPIWSPTTYLFSDAACTIAYTGTPLSTVYVHPTGITAPTTITYTATLTNGSCSSSTTQVVSLNPNPTAITGTAITCIANSTTLSSATAGGSWTSSNTAVATVGSSTGIVSGVAVGTATISYAFGGCATSVIVTVVATPGPITGITIACLGSTTVLGNSVAGGTWSSSNAAIGTVDPTTGIVTGIALGTTTITYSLGGSCYVTTTVTVNPFPSPIVGPSSMCLGTCVTYTCSPTGGLWTSSTPSVITIGVGTGLACAVALGTSTISYRVSGCAVTKVVTVVSTPTPITGTLTTCVGSTTILSHATSGGTWSSSSSLIANVGSSTGVVTGGSIGTATITYSVGAGCFTTSVVTVTAAPPAITGTAVLCVGQTSTLSHVTAGGTWSASCAGILTVGLGTGFVTTSGPGTCSITYTLPSGCTTFRVVTVNSAPSPITGVLSACVGQCTALACATPGGTWSSSTTAVGTINSATGLFCGIAAGTSTVTYSLGSGCVGTAVVTVNPIPAAITGTLTTCAGQCTSLFDTTPFGAWSSSTPAVGSISGAGLFCAVAAGTSTVTYALASGCYTTAVVTANPTPAAISGTLAMCVGTCTTLNSATAGGVWNSSTPAIVNIVGPGGFSCGVSAGTATISYTAAGCTTTAIATVYALPGTISGSTSLCVGQTGTLTNSSPGGTWSCSCPTIATIGSATGLLTGVGAGTCVVTYSLGTGCITTTTITINPNAAPIFGPSTLCDGSTATLTCATPGTWSSSSLAIATIGATSGVVTPLSPGVVTFYCPTIGCSSSFTMTINPLPAAITGGTSICQGATTTLSSTTPGGTWSSSNGNATVGSSTGIVTGVFAGTLTITYMLPTGCYRTTVVLVNANPTGISGIPIQLCEGSTMTLSGTPPGGTWSSSTPAVGTIGLGSGILGCLTSGTTGITYTLPSSCTINTVVTCNPTPAVITGTTSTCIGQCTTLSTTTPGGTWSSGTPAVGTVSTSGVVCGLSAGTTNISYTSSTGCRRTLVVTVFPLPGIISPAAPQVCVGSTVVLSCTPIGGTWTTSAAATATVTATTGVVTGIAAGTVTISYTVGTGCTRTVALTVNPLPNAITGTPTTCVGQTTTLSSTTPGGTWYCGFGCAAMTVGISSGIMTGIGVGGICTVSYTSAASAGGCTTSTTVTVYALPSNITGSLQVCEGSTTILTTTTPGGTWSSTVPAVGTIDATTGVLTGITAGTTMITYTLGTGCFKTAIATVNPLPLPITGTGQVCEAGGTTTLTNLTPGGTWSSGATSVATINSTGVVTGGVAGTTIISYTLPTTCRSTLVVTVFPLPTTLTGPLEVCNGSTVTLSSTPAGGVWSSPSGNVSVNPTTGAVTGTNAGTATISYTQGIGCTRTRDITVNPLPNPITGTPQVCMGQTTTLSTTSTGGNWSSTNTAVATISAAGVVTPVTPGTTVISYAFTSTGCASTVVFTVNGLPTPIAGSNAFCNLTQSLYTSSPAGGTWTSANPSILTIDPVTGLATGVDTFATTITYTLPTGCSVSKGVYLIVAPYPIGGPNAICLAQTDTLTNLIGGGVWSSSNSTVLPVTPFTPTTALITGGNIGSATITYQLSTTGCYSTKDVTVNPIPVGIIGPTQVCEASCVIISNSTPGGTWSSSAPTTATTGITVGGCVVCGMTPGTVIVTYSLSTGCNATFVMTVNARPSPIMGNPNLCVGVTTTLSSVPSGGAWSPTTGSAAIADPFTGVVTGSYVGTTTITYTLPFTGCKRTVDVTVYPLPSNTTGPTSVCVGNVITLNNATPGGGWISSNPLVASVDASGNVSGILPGGCVISYTLPTGCVATHPVSVNGLPTPIGGSLSVCAGFATNLTSGPSGGLWSQDPASTPHGTINMVTGVVSGVTAGIIPVTYTLGTGCRAIETVTVVTLPPVIGGVAQVCVGLTTVLTNAVAGGTWTSSNPSRATIDITTGLVTGISAGTSVITYAVGSGGCFNVRTMTVNPLPAPITGTLQVCEGSQTTLASTTAGGIWISSSTANATVGYISGVVTGITAGTSDITYTLPTGCLQQVQMTVNPTPPAIVGNPHVCIGSANSYTNGMPGGVWSISNPAIATISSTGVVTSVSLGSATITYQMPVTGCMATKQITVQPLPVVYNVTGGGNYCTGTTGVHVGLSGSQIGVSYVLYHGTSVTGYLSGTGSAIDFGLLTLGGTYTVQATNVTSGCQKDMSGSATVVVMPSVTPAVTIAATPTDSLCEGETVLVSPVTTTGGTAPTYIWKVNGTTVSSAPTYSFIPANGDVVTVVMTSNVACFITPTAVANRTLTVMPSATPVATLTADPNDTVCQYNPVTFTANPSYGGNAPTYSWYVNGTVSGTGATYTFVPQNGDEVYCKMVSNYRCRTLTTVQSENVIVGVDSLKIPHVTVYADPGMFIESGKPVTLHTAVTDAGPNPKYQWKVNGTAIAGATLADYTAIFHDYDSITCVVMSSGVCANIGTHDWVFISVTPLGSPQVQSAGGSIQLVPNPNRGMFTVKGTLVDAGNEDVSVEVTDMLGQVVYRGTMTAKQGKVDGQVHLDNNLANGMYLLTLRTTQNHKTFHFVMEQ